MTDLADLYPGFASRYVDCEAGRIFTRIGGAGAPLLLVHGFPETGAMWHALAPALAEHFTVVVADLRGYGWSSAPASRDGAGYTKRVMGRDLVTVMEALGHGQFAFAGHDRGARVGYRLALDHAGRLTRLALLDIVPTFKVWEAIEAGKGASPHWPELARAEPQPEREIARDPDAFYLGLMERWTRDRTCNAFDPRALAHYRAGWGDPSRVHASCEDYRAGAKQDREADLADLSAGRHIACPVHVLASAHYLTKDGEATPLAQWQGSFAPDATGTTIESGHFMAEENPAAVRKALLAFFSS